MNEIVIRFLKHEMKNIERFNAYNSVQSFSGSLICLIAKIKTKLW